MTESEMLLLLDEIKNFSKFTPKQFYYNLVKDRLNCILNLYDRQLNTVYNRVDTLLDNNLDLIKKVIK